MNKDIPPGLPAEHRTHALLRARAAGLCALTSPPRQQRLPIGGSLDLSVLLFKSRIVKLDAPLGRASVGNPDIADIVSDPADRDLRARQGHRNDQRVPLGPRQSLARLDEHRGDARPRQP